MTTQLAPLPGDITAKVDRPVADAGHFASVELVRSGLRGAPMLATQRR